MPAESGSVLLVGVGGQGVVLSSAVAADAARRSGFDVKQSEVHGMSQRGGVVSSHLRYGPLVHSPLIGAGEADAVVALEWNEGVRAIPALRPGGTLIVSLDRIPPPSAFVDRHGGAVAYPAVAPDTLRRTVPDVRAADATSVAAAAGNARAMNSVLLGILSPLLPFPAEAWDGAIAANVPRAALEANRAAFAAGRALRFPAAPAPGTGRPRRRAPAEPPSVGSVDIVDAWCKGEDCAICVRACPEYVLGFEPDARPVRAVRPDACTACMLCEILCPDFAITVRRAAVPAGPSLVAAETT